MVRQKEHFQLSRCGKRMLLSFGKCEHFPLLTSFNKHHSSLIIILTNKFQYNITLTNIVAANSVVITSRVPSLTSHFSCYKMSLQHKKYQHKSIFYCHGRLAQHIPFFLDDDKPNPILLPFLQTLYCHPWLEVFYCNICQAFINFLNKRMIVKKKL